MLRTTAALCVLIAGSALVGCESAQKDDAAAVEEKGFFDDWDLTFGLFDHEENVEVYHLHNTFGDDLVTPGRTQVEHDNRHARTNIINQDLGTEEWSRLWLMDKPGGSAYYPTD